MMFFSLIILPYLLIITTAYLYLIRPERSSQLQIPESDQLPEVSVIVAAKNEEKCLPDLISDLGLLDYPEDKLEIYIVDDHSSDSTAGLIKNASKIHYLLSQGKGKKQALATGLEYANGELIITTDADCRVPASWIRSFAEKYLEEKPDLIIGQVRADHRPGTLSIFSELEFSSLQAVTGGLAMAGHPVMCNGANLGFRKSAVKNYLKSVNPDIASGDDMFLLHSIKKSGGRIIWLYNAEGKVSTQLPHKLRDLFRQRSRWAGKSIHYNDRDTIFVGFSTLIANLSIIAAIILIVFNSTFWPLALTLYLAKTITELLLLSGYLNRPGKLKKLLLFLPSSLIYPFYMLITVLLSLFSKQNW